MRELTIVVLGKNTIDTKDLTIFDFVRYDGGNLYDFLSNIKTKYVLFIKSSDSVRNNFFRKVYSVVKKDFDCCFINYDVMFEYKNSPKINTNEMELKSNLPYYGSFIWNYIFRIDLLLKYLKDYNKVNINEFNEQIKEDYKNIEVINEPVYYHNPNSDSFISINDCFYTDLKPTVFYKNVIYFENGISGTFNGYISWVRNIGKCFNNYDITLLYDDIGSLIEDEFSNYFNCVKRENNINYTCDRLLVTYSDYYYSKNIFCLDKNYLFIHGIQTDYENARRFYDDLFSEYVGVSKLAAEKAVGYYPSDNIKYVYNPFMLDKESVRPHLKLVSAMRSSDIKRPDRIKYLASVLDELDIPYTWNFFTDKNEETNINGLVYRKRVVDPLPYIKDSDYFVILSDSEAFSYSVVEALSVNTKVIVTPLEVYNEIGVVDGENGFIISFDYFEEDNKDKLKDIIMRIYSDKEKTINYEFDSTLYSGYNDIFEH